MLKKYRPLFAIIGVIIFGFLLWYFWNVVIYVIVSAVFSIIGGPLVRRLEKLKIGKFHIPRSLSALLTLIIIVGVFVGFIWFIVPLISNQARIISSIDLKEVLEHFKGTIAAFENFLIRINIISAGETIESSIKAQLESVIDMATFSTVFKNVLSTTGSFLMGAFSILFITFFFLRDEDMLPNFLVLLLPTKYEDKLRHAMLQTRKLLSRYFIGLLGELLSMMTLLTVGLTILGVKNALIIGFLGGLMNIVPYLGPIIGGTIGVLFGVTSAFSMGLYDQIVWLIPGIIGVFLGANIIDNLLLQPFIYSSSVKARPIEIFLVIIMAGSLAGIPGMILAIPSYTVLRIVAKEFLSQFRLVKKLTEKME